MAAPLPTTEKIGSHVIRHLIERLYLLGELKPGKTLNTKSMAIVTHDYWSTWGRWWNGEGRDKTIDVIYEIIDDTVRILHYNEEVSAIVKALATAREGIATLLFTYDEDPNTCSRVKALLNEIDTLVLKYRPMNAITRLIRGPVDPIRFLTYLDPKSLAGFNDID